jgi:hypothetical protein
LDSYRSGNRCINNQLLNGAAEHPAEAVARPVEADCGYENRSKDRKVVFLAEAKELALASFHQDSEHHRDVDVWESCSLGSSSYACGAVRTGGAGLAIQHRAAMRRIR